MSTIRTEIKTAALFGFWLIFFFSFARHISLFQLLGAASSAVSGPVTAPASLAAEWLRRAATLLGWAALLVSASGYGLWPWRWLRLNGVTRAESVVWILALGWGMISSLMFLAGLVGAWTVGSVRAMAGAGFLLALPRLRTMPRGWRAWKSPDRPSRLPCLLAGFGLALMLALAFAPVTYYDSLVYHFALPEAYIKAGRWVGLPYMIYSAFPQALEMLWTFGLLAGNEWLANLIGFALTGLLLAAIALFGRRFLSAAAGAWAAALVALMPAVLFLSSGGYVDIGLTFFGFMSLYGVHAWYQDRQNGWLILAGLMAGWAVSCKYTGAISAAIGSLWIVAGTVDLERRRFPVRLLAKRLALYAVPALLIFLPWALKNIHYVGNPFFPFFYDWGSERLNPWMKGAARGYFIGLAEYRPRSMTGLVSALWDLATQGTHFGGGMDVLGDFGWAPLVALLPTLWLCRRLNGTVRALALYAVLFFVPWGLSRPVLRFLLPLVPVLALLAAQGWVEGVEALEQDSRWIARGFLAALLGTGLFLFFFIGSIISPFRPALGLEDREAYLRRKLDYVGAAFFLNRFAGVKEVLVVGDQRGYYYSKPVLITPVFNDNPVVAWSESAADAEDLRRRIRAQGFTHVVINRHEMERLAPYHLFPFSPAALSRWQGFLRLLGSPLYEDRACQVYAL